MDYSQVVKRKGWKTADYKLIKDNPNKTIYDLTGLGLSKDGAAQLQSIEDANQPKKKKEPLQPVSVEKTQPTKTYSAGDTAVLYNVRLGISQRISRQAAEQLHRKSPELYQIQS